MKNKFKKLINILVVSGIIATMVGCTNSSKEDKNVSNIKDSKEVIVGFDNTFVPMGFLDDKGETVGFDIELAKETFNRLNMDVKFQPIDWTMKETELNSGNVDLLWNGYSLSEERKKVIEYTDSYLENKQIIITLKDSDIKTKKDLKGKKIGTQQGSTALDAIEKDTEVVKNLYGKAPILYDTYDKALRDLEIGRTDAVVGDEVLARYYISKKGEEKYNILEDNFGIEDYVVAFKKGNTELRDKVNDALKEIKDDGSFKKIYSKWFKSN